MHGRHVVHRNIEEALDGILVQIHRDDVVDARHREQIGHELRRDGLTRSGLAILAGVAVMGDDRRNGASARALGGVGHDEQFHEGVVHIEALGGADG